MEGCCTFGIVASIKSVSSWSGLREWLHTRRSFFASLTPPIIPLLVKLVKFTKVSYTQFVIKLNKGGVLDNQHQETDLGRTVFELREARELTQDQLHRRSGVSRVTISKLETGQIGTPRLGTLRRLAEALDVPVQSLLDPKKALAPASQ